MFRRNLRIPLAENKYSVFFPNIEVRDEMNDDSMNAMLRFLLHERAEGKKIKVFIKQQRDFDRARTLLDEDTFYLEGSFTKPGESGTEEFERYVASIDERLTQSGYERYDFLREFARRNINLYAYVDVEHRRSIMLIQNMDIRTYHVAMVMLPKLLPWFFQEHPLTDAEKDLLNSILKDENADVRLEETFQKFFEEYHFSDRLFREQLLRVEKEARECKLEAMRNTVRRIRHDLKTFQDTINDLLKELYIKEEEYESFRMYPEKSADDLVDYITKNKAVEIIDVEGTILKVKTKALFNWYDSDQLERALSHSDSLWYTCSRIDRDETEALLTAIFLQEKYHIRAYAKFEIDMHGGLYAMDATSVSENRIPNTHLGYYNCMGGYNSKINRAMEERDFIEVLELCISSTSSLNMSDTTVCSKFIELLTDEYYDLPILEDDEGNLVSPCCVVKECE